MSQAQVLLTFPVLILASMVRWIPEDLTLCWPRPWCWWPPVTSGGGWKTPALKMNLGTSGWGWRTPSLKMNPGTSGWGWMLFKDKHLKEWRIIVLPQYLVKNKILPESCNKLQPNCICFHIMVTLYKHRCYWCFPCWSWPSSEGDFQRTCPFAHLNLGVDDPQWHQVEVGEPQPWWWTLGHHVEVADLDLEDAPQGHQVEVGEPQPWRWTLGHQDEVCCCLKTNTWKLAVG